MAAKLDPILIPGIRTLLSLSMKQGASQDAWPLIDGNDLRVAVWIYAWNSTPSKIRTWIKGFVGPYAKSITPTEYSQDNVFELSPEPLDDTGIRR